MPSRKELVAYARDDAAVASAIGADLVIFQTLPDLLNSVRHLNPAIPNFDCSVFTGEYVTGGVDEAYMLHIEGLRADNLRDKALSLNLDALEGTDVAGKLPNGASSDHHEMKTGASTPVNGSDDTVGLHNTFNS
ncbi:unnamed protein product [Cyclocybe aegerita]|uniref:Uncharacterized protein n=1 Tax=Cyclocybe aegerita TaxID=1973307 RepID=A0A8S0WJV7_CYCAE|nr:unnamed protein product [Cyclocybe aegerita]